MGPCTPRRPTDPGGVSAYDRSVHARSVPNGTAAPSPSTVDERYVELLKGCLTRDLFPDDGLADVISWEVTPELGAPDDVWRLLQQRGWRLVRQVREEELVAGQSRIPPSAETMVGRPRLDNVEQLVRQVVADDVPGDLVETGVWRGGTVIFMRALLAVLGVDDRTVWVCDSFQGLPDPDPEAYPADASMVVPDADLKALLDAGLAVSVEEVQANFARYGLLDDQVRFVEGWFSDTLPTVPIERIAVLRLDGDLYESTMDALVHLAPKVSSGGFVIVDDYGSIEACRRAVHDYRDAHGIDAPIHEVDWTGAYWQVGV